jgi:hypothetical protein
MWICCKARSDSCQTTTNENGSTTRENTTNNGSTTHRRVNSLSVDIMQSKKRQLPDHHQRKREYNAEVHNEQREYNRQTREQFECGYVAKQEAAVARPPPTKTGVQRGSTPENTVNLKESALRVWMCERHIITNTMREYRRTVAMIEMIHRHIEPTCQSTTGVQPANA